MTEKVYHIYANGKCIYHSLSEEKFTETWEMLHRMVEIIDVKLLSEHQKFEGITFYKESESEIEFLLCEDNDTESLEAEIYKLTLKK